MQKIPAILAFGVLFVLSITALGAAFGFEIWGGLQPCSLCVISRWFYVALGMFSLGGILVTAFKHPAKFWQRIVKALPVMSFRKACLIVSFCGMVFSAFHVGIERKWWRVKMKCTSAVVGVTSIQDYKQRLLYTPRCDRVAWRFLGFSMADMNLLAQIFAVVMAYSSRVDKRRSSRRAPSGGS
jgi:disulfide bond formation protein DsbB